jgi:hypothetical protein
MLVVMDAVMFACGGMALGFLLGCIVTNRTLKYQQRDRLETLLYLHGIKRDEDV